MANYDHKIASELDLEMEEVSSSDKESLQKYIKFLIQFCPDRTKLGFPTYLLIDNNTLIGGLAGGMGKGIFRNRLRRYIEEHREGV
jgi:UDP-N-acetyl-D-mannosaminuronate dehydrogenase